jgi:hypothetical protein
MAGQAMNISRGIAGMDVYAIKGGRKTLQSSSPPQLFILFPCDICHPLLEILKPTATPKVEATSSSSIQRANRQNSLSAAQIHQLSLCNRALTAFVTSTSYSQLSAKDEPLPANQQARTSHSVTQSLFSAESLCWIRRLGDWSA